jgi:hypothetical protein
MNPRSDRQNAARYADVAHQLRVEAAAWANAAALLAPDPLRYDTYAASVLIRVRPLLEQLAQIYSEIADGPAGAQELCDTYRSLVEHRFDEASA